MNPDAFFEKSELPVDCETATYIVSAMKKNALPEWARTHPLRVAHFLALRSPLPTPLDFAARYGFVDQVTEALQLSGESLTPENFLVKDPSGWTALHSAAHHGYLYQITAALRFSGKPLTREHFLTPDSCGQTPLSVAGMNRNLDQIFIPSLWVGRVGELGRLWDAVPEGRRGKIDYVAVRNEAILLSVRNGSKIPAARFHRASGEAPSPQDGSHLSRGHR